MKKVQNDGTPVHRSALSAVRRLAFLFAVVCVMGACGRHQRASEYYLAVEQTRSIEDADVRLECSTISGSQPAVRIRITNVGASPVYIFDALYAPFTTREGELSTAGYGLSFQLLGDPRRHRAEYRTLFLNSELRPLIPGESWSARIGTDLAERTLFGVGELEWVSSETKRIRCFVEYLQDSEPVLSWRAYSQSNTPSFRKLSVEVDKFGIAHGRATD